MDDAGAAVGGATIQVYTGTAVYSGTSPMAVKRAARSTRTASASGTPTAVTAADGTFTVAGVPSGTFRVVVFSSDGVHPNYHGLATATATASVTLTRLSSSAQAWISQVNKDRAQYGSAAVSVDESLVEAAAYRAKYMGVNGYYAHDCPSTDASCQTGQQVADKVQNDTSVATYENIAADGTTSTWQNAETAFMAEAANCSPQPANTSTCQWSSVAPETGHFLNITRPANLFVGVGEYDNGVPFSTSLGTNLNYYVEEFE